MAAAMEAELRENESRLKEEMLKEKLLKDFAAVVAVLENEILRKDSEIDLFRKRIENLEAENEGFRYENEFLQTELSKQSRQFGNKIKRMECELADIKSVLADEASTSSKLIDVTNSYKSRAFTPKSLRTCKAEMFDFVESGMSAAEVVKEDNFLGVAVERTEKPKNSPSNCDGVIGFKTRAPRIPKPPPRPSLPAPPSILPRCKAQPLPPPPPPPPARGQKQVTAMVSRVPEVVEFYHSLVRREPHLRRGGGVCATDAPMAGTKARDMIGEIEKRSSYLMAIKTDVETQRDFIKTLIKEVEGAVFTDIEDVVPFVKWLDDELSYLVDERAVLKHFDWPEKKADALREAAFGYCDLKKIESEAISFRDDPRQPCSRALKKMQSLFEN